MKDSINQIIEQEKKNQIMKNFVTITEEISVKTVVNITTIHNFQEIRKNLSKMFHSKTPKIPLENTFAHIFNSFIFVFRS